MAKAKKPEQTISALALKLTKSSHKNAMQRAKRDCLVVDQQLATVAGLIAHIGPRTTPTYTLDRIDYSKGYLVGNVRWASKQTQSLNRRNAVLLTHNGETLPLLAWASRLKVPAATLRRRKRLGWTDAEIITGSRVGARPAPDSPWPAGDESIWERLYVAHSVRGETRERFQYRVCDERVKKLFRYITRPEEPIGVGDEGQPIFEPLPPGFTEHLERAKRLLAHAELKLAAAARRAADPFAEVFKPKGKP